MKRVKSTGYRQFERQKRIKLYTAWAINALVVVIGLLCLMAF